MTSNESNLNIIPYLIAVIPALILSLLLSQIGDMAFVAMIAVCLALLFLYFIFRFSFFFLCISIIVLGLSPFFLSFDIGSLPTVFVDEIVYIFLVIYLIITHFIFRSGHFYIGDRWIAFLLCVLVASQIPTFFLYPIKIGPLRNFIETYVWGLVLFYLFLNEANKNNVETIITMIVVVTLILSAFTIIEKLLEVNPVLNLLDNVAFFREMKEASGYKYFSPEQVKMARGFYRPYTTFFHPSEAGTFIGMGLPFVLYKFRRSTKGLIAFFACFVLTAIIFNFTRGVWVALTLSLLIFYKPMRKLAFFLVLPGALLVIILLIFWGDNPFMHRLFDPTNIYARFFYWDVASKIFKKYFLLGIGHMRYKEVYLDFVRTIGPNMTINVKEVFVADNIYITTLIEHGILGLVSLLTLVTTALVKLRGWHHRLSTRKGQIDNSQLILACMFAMSVYLCAGLLADVHQFTKVTRLFFIIMGIGFSLTLNKKEGLNIENIRSENVNRHDGAKQQRSAMVKDKI